jgi:hypothetical protein
MLALYIIMLASILCNPCSTKAFFLNQDTIYETEVGLFQSKK